MRRIYEVYEAAIRIPISTEMLVSVGIEDCDPIPLTPEILEKCGFRKSKNHSLDFYHDVLGNKSFCFRINRPFKHEGNWYPEKQYLHELQNLYFALTGEELQVQL